MVSVFEQAFFSIYEVLDVRGKAILEIPTFLLLILEPFEIT